MPARFFFLSPPFFLSLYDPYESRKEGDSDRNIPRNIRFFFFILPPFIQRFVQILENISEYIIVVEDSFKFCLKLRVEGGRVIVKVDFRSKAETSSSEQI